MIQEKDDLEPTARNLNNVYKSMNSKYHKRIMNFGRTEQKITNRS